MKSIFKPGDIGFVMHHESWLSRTIAWFMQSKWSHTLVVYDTSSFLHNYTVETSEAIVFNGNMERYMEDPNLSIEVLRHDDVTLEQGRAIANESQKLLMSWYGYLQLISFAIRAIVLKLFKIKIRNFIRQGLVCDHVVLYGYSKYSDIDGLKGIDPESIHTEELYQLVKSLGFKTIYSKEQGMIDR